MTRPSTLFLASILPSLFLLHYLAVHSTEGWQLAVVTSLGTCFALACRWQSPLGLATSYLLTSSWRVGSFG